LQAAIWAVGLKQEFREDGMERISKSLRETAEKLNNRFSVSVGGFQPHSPTLNA